MKLQKIIIFSLLSLFSISAVLADSTVPTTQETITNLQNMVKRFSDTIMKLQEENVKLKDKIAELNTKIGTIKPVQAISTGSIISTGTIVTNVTTGIVTKASEVEKYNKLIEKINSMSGQIFKDLQVSSGSSIGLFEFIEPNSFFISVDDLVNPEGVTAFKKKILYSYDKNYNLNIDGVFDLDYKSQYYVTKYGKNPFARVKRIRVKNPNYKGKLLDEVIVNSSSASTSSKTTATTATKTTTNTSTTATSTVDTTNVTLDSVKTAYAKNKILDALKLSTEYIKTDPNNIEVAKIRYRSFYILGKYDEALAEITKIENGLGTPNVEKTVLCDAKIISKLAKKVDLNKKYADLCAAKK